jgi:hypothetical protein
MNNCTQWSDVFTMEFRLKLRVWKVNAYLICVDVHEASAGVEGIHRMTGCG